MTLPTGVIYGPVLGPVTISLGSGQTISRLRIQTVPASAPAGQYHYNGYAVATGDTSTDSFIFTKAGAGGAAGLSSWSNTGDEFGVEAQSAMALSGSRTTPTTGISPNPFNPTTTISYELRAASFVSLRVYDTAGRLVTTLVDGMRDAGTHEVPFDGSHLTSGVYLYTLAAGGNTMTGKMVLLK
jgi:hypothetical protein